jgi:hypothetical protein
VQEAAWALNFQPYEILALVSLGILNILGDPTAPNATKYFFADDILAFGKDRAKMKKATNVMYQARVKKNQQQKARRQEQTEAASFSTSRPAAANGKNPQAQALALGMNKPLKTQ